MIFSWLQRRRRRRLLAAPFPAGWERLLARHAFYERLDPARRRRLHDIVRVLVAEKTWEGCGGLELTDEIRVTIAAQAARLILDVEHEYFEGVEEILVYPSSFVAPWQHVDEAGVVTEGHVNEGEAWHRGPVILSWDDAEHDIVHAEDGHNLVLHEFAHKLDMANGFMDGTPELANREAYRTWQRIMTEEYERLIDDTEDGRATVLDAYGATDPAEFFAVATECFFERPRDLAAKHPSLYGLLRDYYRQDPARPKDADDRRTPG